ncbi:hypothetical protein PENTCL1PPCAC_26285, partial [Pristionchus entomophagus]
LFQIVEAYYELTPSHHVVIRCWDTRSTIPYDSSTVLPLTISFFRTYQRPLRTHESIVEQSRGKTVDIYCFDYDNHVGEDGRNIRAGDWVLFCNVKVGYPRNGADTVLAMHEGGIGFGR